MSDTDELARFLSQRAPFDSLAEDRLREVAQAGRIELFSSGQLILNAFDRPSPAVYVVMAGEVELWGDLDRIGQAADERLGPGEMFGFSAMLTKRSVGPRVVAVGPVRVVAIPSEVAEPAFASVPGARFLAAHSSYTRPRIGPPSYSLVDELIITEPLTVRADEQIGDVARKITETGAPCAVVTGIGDRAEPAFGLITDALLRRHVLVDGIPPSSPVSMIMDTDVTVTQLGDSAAEALITMLDRDAEMMLVLDRNRRLAGVIMPRDFAISPTTAGVSVHEQIRRAGTIEELKQRSRRVAPMLADLLSRGLASGKVIAVHSAILDTIVRRALVLSFAEQPDVSLDAFTWLALGSNGRREAVLSSDVDSAVAFEDDITETELARYRTAFGRVDRVLSEAGLIADDHGATPTRAPFSRANASWRSAARGWLAARRTSRARS